MKKKILLSAMLGFFSFSSLWADDYGLPAGIQEGNILHCFNWPAKDVKAALPQIAAAGFGSVQLSPLQRGDVGVGSPWHDLYRPYDLAFKASSYCSEADLKDLCTEAAKYGIKIIVDVVANHVDKTAGYHDTWWDSSGRVRWNGGINYGDRNSITHGQLGDYGDVNSESAEVAARGKAYVEKLKSLGVKGCRWDAAKHIGLPSEGCNFWKEVTSVSGMYHYGEILDAPGPNASIIKEYTTYMSVTDNKYSNGAARENGGIPFGFGGAHVVDYGCPDTKMVYWGESHDTYSNDEWSQNVDQAVIDRAYCAFACRNGATALYLSRPNTKGFGNIKVGKGSTAFTGKHIAEVNKFRNAMVGKADWCEAAGSTFTVTRKDGGAVIVAKNGGNVSVTNGGGYCPAGTYTDRVSGNTFTVTATTISGNIGSSGVAVLYNGGVTPSPTPNPGPDPDPTPGPTPDPSASMWVLGNIEGSQWDPSNGAPMVLSGGKYVAANVKLAAATGETACYFNITDALGADWDALNMAANRYGAAAEGVAITLGTPAAVKKYANNVDASGCLSWSVAPGSYDITLDLSAMTVTVVNAGTNPTPNPDPTPNPTPNPGVVTISGDYNLAYSGDKTKVYYWGEGVTAPEWPGVEMQQATGSDGKTYKVYKVPAGTTGIIFSNTGDSDKTGDLTYTGSYIMNDSGSSGVAVSFGSNPNPNPDPQPQPNPGVLTISGDYNLAYNGDKSKVYYWGEGVTAPEWPGVAMSQATGSDGKSYKVAKVPTGTTGIIFSNTGDSDKTGDLTYTGSYVMNDSGSTGIAVVFSSSPVPNPDPDPDPDPNPGPNPNPGPIVITGESLQTDYYKVNPNGQSGSNRTVTMNFNEQKSTTALSNWGAEDLIAQGVARDVCQAFKGKHERPIVDSYALYAAYDSQNLYLGVQYVYTVWDLYGEGKQGGESKPYNMDGKLCFAFDLDPNKDFKGITNENSSIWQDKVYTTFENGSDAWWYGSTKPGVGTPGFFVPNAAGICDYKDPNSCKTSTVKYGYADGLLPSIDAVYGQSDFGYDPELLKGNDGFVNLRSEIDDSAHTFYEFTFPLSLLGVTESYIKNNGIGVMVVDLYGSSAHSSLPYDPSFYDNVFDDYSQDPSSSAEKEDQDVVTFAHARIGHIGSSAIEQLPDADAAEEAVYYTLQGLRVENPSAGLYIVVRGNKVTKEYIR